jgi:hypothetical protein
MAQSKLGSSAVTLPSKTGTKASKTSLLVGMNGMEVGAPS